MVPLISALLCWERDQLTTGEALAHVFPHLFITRVHASACAVRDSGVADVTWATDRKTPWALFIADAHKTSTTISQHLPPRGHGEVLASCACRGVLGPVLRQWSSEYGTRLGAATHVVCTLDIFMHSGKLPSHSLRSFIVYCTSL